MPTEKPTLTEKQRNLLNKVVSGRTEKKLHVIRAEIIILLDQGLPLSHIAKKLNLHRDTVRKWRDRWVDNQEKLTLFDEKETGINYQRQVLSVLDDAQRPGKPCKFTPEQICQIINVATEKPEDSGVAFSHWTLSSLAEECKKRKIVDNISTSQLAVFLKSGGYKTP